MNLPKGSFFGGVLLIAGTCIGAGMLALPVVTGIAGFYPAMAINFICWLVMMATGLLFLEATLWSEDGANVLTISKKILGNGGAAIGGFFFLFLYYCLMVSYLAGGVPLMGEIFSNATGINLSLTTHFVLFSLLFGGAVLWGVRFVDRFNWLLMVGLVVSFLMLIGIGFQQIDLNLWKHQNWSLSWLALPTLFSAYGYHNVIPSLATYLHRDRQKLRWVIIIGTLIPFLAYSIWQAMIIGLIPLEGLQETAKEGVPISQALYSITGHPWVSMLGLYFGFFALVTSLLGVALSMVDFLGDGLKMPRTGLSRLFLCLLVFVPPAIFAIYKPGIFISAIGVAGGVGEAVLNGLLPVAMVFVGRYWMKLPGENQTPGGKKLLGALFIFSLGVMLLEFWILFH